MDTTENLVKVNAGMAISDSNAKEKKSSYAEKEENRHKQRKSNDSVWSRHSTSRDHKSPSCKCQPDSHNDQRSLKAQKRGSLSSSDAKSNPSDNEVAAESGSFNGSFSNVNRHYPTVPPLKIIIPSGYWQCKESCTHKHSKVSSSNKPLPYVVNSITSIIIDQRSLKAQKRGSISSSDAKNNPSDKEVAAKSGSFNGSFSNVNCLYPKVPPLKIIIPSGYWQRRKSRTHKHSKVSSSNKQLPYVVNSITSIIMDTDSINESFFGEGVREGSKTDLCNKSKDENHPPEERFQRVTRSSQHMQAAMSGTTLKQYSDKAESTQNVVSSSSQKGDASGESFIYQQLLFQINPIKREMQARENTNKNGSENPSCASSSSEDSQQQHQFLNTIEMFLNIRKQVDKRRRGMAVIRPKPPKGYEHYLLNRSSYALEGNAASRLSVPMFSPPQSLEEPIKQMFNEQEKERYTLRLQHLIEREKLVLSVEQEVLRVHGQAARAMNNQSIPLSFCTILKDEEIYNELEDKKVRSRYNGKLFSSSLQDVAIKWEKIKEAMLLRHHNEAESLHAVQKLFWEEKMKELAIREMKASPEIFLPMVHVSDDFDLLPL